MSDKVIIGTRPSNGTEGSIMQSQLCDRCTSDHEWHRFNAGHIDQPDESCPILMAGLFGDDFPEGMSGPPEWSHIIGGSWSCTGFVRCSCGPRGPKRDEPEPRPPKPIPGQSSMFDLDPEALYLYPSTVSVEAR